MPTSIGHAAAGIAAAWTADLIPGQRAWRTAPRQASWYRRAGDGFTLLCGALGAVADLDLVIHSHRGATHSIGAAIIAGLLAAAFALVARRPVMRVSLMSAAAYGTHVVLDWLGVDTYWPFGIQALWPFSARWYISGLDIFPQTERAQFLSAAAIQINLAAVAREMMILTPLLVILWIARTRSLAASVG
jgi:membrane-bound metal-dependent hydrolase YbcI (DUF457 family)